MHGRIWTTCFALLAGCGELPDLAKPAGDEEVCADCGQAFDPAATGTIKGRVTWDDTVPKSETMVATAIAYHPHLHKNPVRYETPHAPRVHPETLGVADAVVFLRGIDPHLAKPWHHDAVHIDFRDRRLLIQQGAQATNVGFVRRGDKLTTANHDADYHALRGRGAAFFTLPLITTQQHTETTLKQTGVVELFDAAGYYWVHAHLFVAEHPYYARTDSAGHFTLELVPAGAYEIVCWMPNWNVVNKERDPETMYIVRQTWAPAAERKQAVLVQAGAASELEFHLSATMFK